MKVVVCYHQSWPRIKIKCGLHQFTQVSGENLSSNKKTGIHICNFSGWKMTYGESTDGAYQNFLWVNPVNNNKIIFCGDNFLRN